MAEANHHRGVTLVHPYRVDHAGMTDTGSMLTPGQRAPDFSLPSSPQQCCSLADYRGAPVILAFYPADWSPVCGDEMALYQAMAPVFAEHKAAMLGISVDGVWSHLAFASDRGVQFPLLADFEPKGEVARRYGVYNDAEGLSERALFVIDGEGVIAWSYLSPRGVNPGADGILAALEELEARERVVS
jgi:peroxiredoxin